MGNKVLFRNDVLIEVGEFRAASDGLYINDAIGEVLIKTRSGVDVTGPYPLLYVPGSDGLYQATIPESAPLQLSADYIAEISLSGGVGLKGFWLYPFTVVARIT